MTLFASEPINWPAAAVIVGMFAAVVAVVWLVTRGGDRR